MGAFPELYEEVDRMLTPKQNMLEVIKALGELEHTTLEEIINIANTKSIKRGAFKDKIFLEKVIDNK